MADNTMGMLGLSPEMVQQQLRAQDEAKALAYSKLDPLQQATFGMYNVGQQVGRGLGGLFGGVDPAVARAQGMQDLSRSIAASGVDPSDPAKFFPAMIKEAQARGMTDLVMPLMKQYQDTMDKAATAEYHRAMAKKANEGYEYKQDYLGRVMVLKDGKPVGFYSAADFKQQVVPPGAPAATPNAAPGSNKGSTTNRTPIDNAWEK
jgi:hypothetical protein